MIHYQLQCGSEHRFDGWFRDSAAFDAQAMRGLVCCPECGDTSVNRALMAPAIGRARVTLDQGAKPDTPAPEKVAAGLPDQVRAGLQKIRAEVERTSDYVGPAFAEEARRIHRGETAQRNIYGESTPDQAEALADEGIDVTHVPWISRADS